MSKRKPLYAKIQRNTEKQREISVLYGFHAVRAALCNPARRLIKLSATKNALNALADLLDEAQKRGLEIETVASEALLHEALRPHHKAASHRNPRKGRRTASSREASQPQNLVHQGVVLWAEPLSAPSLADTAATNKPLIVLDQVTDPRNVGAILRVAAVFGAGAVIVTRHHSPPQSGALTKAASGALEHVPLLVVANLARCLKTLSEAGYSIIGLDERGELPLQTALKNTRPAKPPVPKDHVPIVFILGAEGKGLRRLTRTHCQILAHLPHPSHELQELHKSHEKQTDFAHVDSRQADFTTLNVATAAAITLYEYYRQTQS